MALCVETTLKDGPEWHLLKNIVGFVRHSGMFLAGIYK